MYYVLWTSKRGRAHNRCYGSDPFAAINGFRAHKKAVMYWKDDERDTLVQLAIHKLAGRIIKQEVKIISSKFVAPPISLDYLKA